eukprot:462937-Prorocentrum_minimum.AAC.1
MTLSSTSGHADIGADSTSTMKKNSEEAAVLRACKLIVWDEVPMAHKRTVEGGALHPEGGQ